MVADPLACAGTSGYVTRHGFGYSVFEARESGIVSELTIYVALDVPVKFLSLKIQNKSQATRHLSATFCTEWVLAELRTQSLLHVVTEIDGDSGAIVARNPFSAEFPGRVTFLDVSEANRTVTGDRNEFFGRNGTAANPAAMSRTSLSGKVGAGLDPCGAIQTTIEIAPGQEREIVFRLGAATSIEEARGFNPTIAGCRGCS